MADTPKHPAATPEQIQANLELNLQIGQAIVAWGRLETVLCQWFEQLTKMNRVVARAVFFSQEGNYAKCQMFKAALSNVKIEPDCSPYLEKIISKTQKYAESRNRIAHGETIFVDDTRSQFYHRWIVMRGRQMWSPDIPEDDILTIDNVKYAAQNFGHLTYCALLPLRWDGKDPKRSPDTLLELIQKLPNPAHSAVLDPNFLAQFAIEESTLSLDR
jgi:hypothetical protein